MKCYEYDSLGFIHKHFIFFTTFKWVQGAARVFGPGKLFQPNVSNTLAYLAQLWFAKEMKYCEYDISKWHFKMTFQNDISKWHFKMTFQNDISKWHFKMTFQNDSSKGKSTSSSGLHACNQCYKLLVILDTALVKYLQLQQGLYYSILYHRLLIWSWGWIHNTSVSL